MGTYTGSDGAQLHYDEHGTGPTEPLIIIGGGAARHPDYLDDLAGLSKKHRLVIPHLRGVGHSAAPMDSDMGSFWRQAEDIEHLSNTLGSQRSVVIGHSAGTRLAISYAVRYPDRLSALVLITPPASYLVDEPSDTEEIAHHRRGEVEFDSAWEQLMAGPDLSSDHTFTTWQTAIAPVGYASWGPQARAHARIGAYNVDAARAFLTAQVPDNLTARVTALATPTLVIAGAQDTLVGLAPVRALAELFAHGQLAVLDECGHYPWVEQPEAFHSQLEPFLLQHVEKNTHKTQRK